MKNIFSLDSSFANFMNTLAGIIWVGVLWLVCSLPLITLGAASCAAYNVTVNVVRHGRNYVTSSFFEAFKENWKVSLPVQIIALTLFLLLGFDCIYLYGYGTEFSQMLTYIIYAFSILFFVIMFYLYPTMQRFDESRIELFKIAFYMTFRHILSSIALLLIFIIAILAVYFMPWSILIIPGIWWYLQSFIIERILRKFSTTEDDDETEEDEEYKDDNIEDDYDEENNRQIDDLPLRKNRGEKNTGEREDRPVRTVIVKRRRLKKIFKRDDHIDSKDSNMTSEDNDNKEDKEIIEDVKDKFEDRVIKKN